MFNKTFGSLIVLVTILPSLIPAQSVTQNQVVSLGSLSYPSPSHVAPGEVLTLVTTALNVTDAVASGLPLPRSLSGVSVLARVIGATDSSGYPASLPILRIYNVKAAQMPSGVACSGFPNSIYCSSTQITVQIPTEGVCAPGPVSSGRPQTCGGPPYYDFPPLLILNVSANGVTGPDLPLQVPAFDGRPLNSCDSIFGPQPSNTCHPLVTHADGTLVTAANPAKIGETITLYAVGLGFDNSVSLGPPTGTGPDKPESLPPSLGGVIFTSGSFDQTGNVHISTAINADSDWAGLIPGYVGLFQVNVTVPPGAVQPQQTCGPDGNVQLTMGASLKGADSVTICVQP